MTSAEQATVDDAEATPGDADLLIGMADLADDSGARTSETPWLPWQRSRGGTTAPAATAPAASAPGTVAPASASSPSSVPGTVAPQSVPSTTIAPVVGSAPTPVIGPTPVVGTPVPDGLLSPRQRPEPGTDRDDAAGPDTDRLGNGDTLSQMLPALSQALSGLASPTAADTGPRTGSGTGGSSTTAPLADATVTGADDEAVTVGLSPQAQRALRILKVLAALYGAREAAAAPGSRLGSPIGSTDGTGATATGHRAAAMFQRHAAGAFTNLDNRLANYIANLDGSRVVDREKLLGLIRETNVALAALGPDSYSADGQRKVNLILTRALQYAHRIVGTGQANSTETAAHINQLTNQYLYNLAGKTAPATAGAATGGGAGGATAAGQRAIQAAMAQTGKPYIWGGTGPNGFDCSGLMQHAARQAGVSIPRVSEDQYAQLPKVRPSDIRPGDLIFPESSFSNGRPGHVMMYIGDGRCIAASRTGVPIGTVSLPSSYRATRWT